MIRTRFGRTRARDGPVRNRHEHIFTHAEKTKNTEEEKNRTLRRGCRLLQAHKSTARVHTHARTHDPARTRTIAVYTHARIHTYVFLFFIFLIG